jgi:hypothetical protein
MFWPVGRDSVSISSGAACTEATGGSCVTFKARLRSQAMNIGGGELDPVEPGARLVERVCGIDGSWSFVAHIMVGSAWIM